MFTYTLVVYIPGGTECLCLDSKQASLQGAARKINHKTRGKERKNKYDKTH